MTLALNAHAKKIGYLVLVLALGGWLAACDDDRSVGDAIEDAGDAVGDAANDAGDALDDAADDVEDSMDNVN